MPKLQKSTELAATALHHLYKNNTTGGPRYPAGGLLSGLLRQSMP